MHPTLVSRRVPFTALAAAALAVLAGPAAAADRYWSYAAGCGAADFTSTSCWRAGASGAPGGGTVAAPPAAGDSVFLVRDDTSSLNNTFATSAATSMPMYGALTIYATGGGVTGLALDRNNLRVSGNTVLGRPAAGGEPVGRGRIIQTGGTASFNRLEMHSGSEYNLSGGSMSAVDLWSYGGSTFNQTGGTVTSGVGSMPFFGGRYFLDGGVLDIRGASSFPTTTSALGTLDLSGGTLRINPGQTLQMGTLNYIGSAGDMLTNAKVDAIVFNVRNDYGAFRPVTLANDVRATTLNVGGASGAAGNGTTASFTGGTHVINGAMTVSAGAGNFSSVTLKGNSSLAEITTNRLEVGSDPAALGSAMVWAQSFSSLVVAGPANIGQAGRAGASLLATAGGNVLVSGPLNLYGSATVGSGSSLQVGGITTIGGGIGSSLTVGADGQFAGDKVNAGPGSTVGIEGGGRLRGGSAPVTQHRFTNEGTVQFSGTGGSMGHTLENRAGGAVRVGAGAVADFERGYFGRGSMDIAAGGVARFSADGIGATTRTVGFTGEGRSEYGGTVILDLAAGDITDVGSFSLLGSARLAAPLGAGRLVVGGELGFAGQLSVSLLTGVPGVPVPGEGSRYDLFDWGSSTGSFALIDFSGAPLAPGLFWDSSELYTAGVLKVSAVPEPGTWALWMAGVACMGALARRRRA
jgi:hypothetical protein